MRWKNLEGILLNRFLRDYKLIITTTSQTIEVTAPLNIDFDCEKSILSDGLNTLNIKIYNLTEAKRNQLVKDKDEKKYIRVQLFIGYEGNIKQVFQGNVNRAYTERAGADLATMMECIDGLADVKSSFSSKTASTKKQAVQEILKDMPNTSIGKITESNKIYRNKVIMGSSYEELKKLVQPDEIMFIDEEKLYIIKDTEVSDNYAPVISSDTGLIGIPKKEDKIVEVTTILNPAIKLGGLAQLESIYAPYLNGTYRVESSSFKGSFDGSDWTQNVRLKQR